MEKGIDGGDGGYRGVPVHSQVMKIKHPSLQQAEMMRVLLRGFAGRERSPSPLGPIPVGNA
jgi:hypothetical protein